MNKSPSQMTDEELAEAIKENAAWNYWVSDEWATTSVVGMGDYEPSAEETRAASREYSRLYAEQQRRSRR